MVDPSISPTSEHGRYQSLHREHGIPINLTYTELSEHGRPINLTTPIGAWRPINLTYIESTELSEHCRPINLTYTEIHRVIRAR